jgi:hypothetical protein
MDFAECRFLSGLFFIVIRLFPDTMRQSPGWKAMPEKAETACMTISAAW